MPEGDVAEEGMKRALLWLAAALFAASLALAWVLMRSATVRELPPLPAVSGATVAALYATTLPDVAGRNQALAQWRGKVLVVNYWATWCTPCRAELPEFSKLHTRYAARGVQFVGIATEGADKVGPFAQEAPVSYPLLIGGQEAIKATLPFGNEPQAVPFTLVLDRDGQLRAAVLGRMHEEVLIRLLDSLVRPAA